MHFATIVTLLASAITMAAAQKNCGVYCYKQISTGCKPMNANNGCFDTADIVNGIEFDTHHCGLCVWFKDDFCQGDITWSGGPGPIGKEIFIPDSKSYFCLA